MLTEICNAYRNCQDRWAPTHQPPSQFNTCERCTHLCSLDSRFTGGSWLELRLVEHECPTRVPRANRPRTPPAAPGSGGGPSQAALAYGLARWYDDRGDPDRARQAYRRIVSEAPWAAFGAIAAETELANLSDAENPVW
jgi:hypothetical protein